MQQARLGTMRVGPHGLFFFVRCPVEVGGEFPEREGTANTPPVAM